tara:strand:+ start:498 stop:806 length:309 start_codon:yes stop_codon:yes gene_type:complete
MSRPKGSKNKLTIDVKEQLVNLIGICMNSIDIKKMTTDQKLKFLQLSMHYVVPKLRSSIIKQEQEQDLPLWLEDAQIEVISREKETDEWSSEFYPIPKRAEA